jgi:hypothetical protein
MRTGGDIAPVAAKQHHSQVDQAVDRLFDWRESPARRPLAVFHPSVGLRRHTRAPVPRATAPCSKRTSVLSVFGQYPHLSIAPLLRVLAGAARSESRLSGGKSNRGAGHVVLIGVNSTGVARSRSNITRRSGSLVARRRLARIRTKSLAPSVCDPWPGVSFAISIPPSRKPYRCCYGCCSCRRSRARPRILRKNGYGITGLGGSWSLASP